MKHLKHIFLCLAPIFLLGACTQNDGHIGKLFGSWSLSSMSVNGEVREFPVDYFTTMSFQSDIVMFVLADNLHNTYKCFGTWARHDDILSLNFKHHSDNTPEGSGIFAAPAWLDIPDGISDYQIAGLTSGRLELVRTDTDGNIYIYKFKKTW